jgi:ATP synthase protein I
MRQPDALLAKRILVVQFVIALVLAVAAWPFGTSILISVLIGAAVCLLANSIFAVWVFGRYQAQEPGSLLIRFYGAEIIKLSLILGLFAIAFKVIEGLSVPALLAAYFAVQVFPAVFAAGWDARRDTDKIRER